MLGLALLGGLILNLMPCVLPVLSLKLLSVVGQGGARAPREVRVGFLASAAGILVSFLVLAGDRWSGCAPAASRSAGASSSSSRCSSPAWRADLTLFAANLLGFFEVPLPGAVARLRRRRQPTAGATASPATS